MTLSGYLFPQGQENSQITKSRETNALHTARVLQAKFSGRVTLLPETTLRLLRFGNLASKARTDNKTGK